VREIIQDYTPKDGVLNYDIRRIVLRELCQLIYQPVWGSIEAEYRAMVLLSSSCIYFYYFFFFFFFFLFSFFALLAFSFFLFPFDLQ
jgi:hypothetical protein